MSNDLIPIDKEKKEGGAPFWDWADRRTWLIVAAIVVIGLLMAAIPALMPRGRQADVPAIHTY